MNRPLVSVVIPVFNASETLREAVASVQAQEVDDLEIVVVDDGSTDGTPALVEAMASEDGRVRLISQENAGSPSARANGFRQSRGTFVSTLDGDDLWPEDKLGKQLDVLREDPDAVVIGGIKRFHEQDGRREWLGETMPFPYNDSDSYLRRLLAAENQEMAMMATFCAKREHLLEDNYDPAFLTAHDWEAWLRLAAKHRFVPLESVLYLYRKHLSSVTRRRPRRQTIDSQLSVLRKHLPLHGLSARERDDIWTTQVARIARRYMDRREYGGAWYCLRKGAARPSVFTKPEYIRLVLSNAKRQAVAAARSLAKRGGGQNPPKKRWQP